MLTVKYVGNLGLKKPAMLTHCLDWFGSFILCYFPFMSESPEILLKKPKLSSLSISTEVTDRSAEGQKLVPVLQCLPQHRKPVGRVPLATGVCQLLPPCKGPYVTRRRKWYSAEFLSARGRFCLEELPWQTFLRLKKEEKMRPQGTSLGLEHIWVKMGAICL